MKQTVYGIMINQRLLAQQFQTRVLAENYLANLPPDQRAVGSVIAIYDSASANQQILLG